MNNKWGTFKVAKDKDDKVAFSHQRVFDIYCITLDFINKQQNNLIVKSAKESKMVYLYHYLINKLQSCFGNLKENLCGKDVDISLFKTPEQVADYIIKRCIARHYDYPNHSDYLNVNWLDVIGVSITQLSLSDYWIIHNNLIVKLQKWFEFCDMFYYGFDFERQDEINNFLKLFYTQIKIRN